MGRDSPSPASRASSARDSSPIRKPRDVVSFISCVGRARGRVQQGQVRITRWCSRRRHAADAGRSGAGDSRHRRRRDRRDRADRGHSVGRSAARSDGRIVDILVREGQGVAAGTPLFKVDDAELKAQVAKAEADRDVAQRNLERTKQLMAQNASSQSDLEKADAGYRSAQASYDLLKTRLDRTVVRAPFAGLAGRRLVSIGTYVNAQTPLISLQSINPQYATFQVPERYADRLRQGQLVSFQVAALPGKNFSGEVVFVDPVVELPGRTILIKARVPNPEHRLQAGMFIEARLEPMLRIGHA